MDLQEFIDRERREAVANITEENKKVSEKLKETVAELDKTVAERDKATAELDRTVAKLDKTAAERDKAQADQLYFQKLTSILLDKNLVDELKRAVEDETYKETLYVEFGVKSAQD